MKALMVLGFVAIAACAGLVSICFRALANVRDTVALMKEMHEVTMKEYVGSVNNITVPVPSVTVSAAEPPTINVLPAPVMLPEPRVVEPTVAISNTANTNGSEPASTVLVAPPAQAVAKSRVTSVKANEPPGISCGHCGTRIKSDPINEISLSDTETYRVYKCPKCSETTLISPKAS